MSTDREGGPRGGDWLCLCLRVWEEGRGRPDGASLQSRMTGTPEKGLKVFDKRKEPGLGGASCRCGADLCWESLIIRNHPPR